MKNKKKFRFWVITRNILLSMVGALLIGAVFHNVMSIYEQKKYPALGKLVEVDGRNMHIYTKGNGENTIVLLSGLGTAAPVLDFEPLINELAKTNKIVVVEPFGYGWSDLTDKERTVENIVEELRTALNKSNIEGPYILMPHSLSGIYSMYYADKYPDDIEAIIGIDFTLPKALEYFNESPPSLPKYMSLLSLTGMARLALSISPEDFLPIADKGTYSDENLKMTKIITTWKGYNKNVVNEANEITNNIKKTKEMSFPPNMPVMIFTTDKDKVKEDGPSNITFYQSQLSNMTSNKIVILEGHHYLHWTQFKEMSDYVNEFIETFERDSLIE
ncbi:pimeloyl-ACP methyl ester carboxylesterase [Bacillus pakistanensis]|uniref:Pimeloyl-ACP methyl ester carboxylesterase n=1 Tax=Rossellomorea pakistanensis TaxID=992288 RepID=A0ABS2NCB4_9BACI|nr:alpha/beta hydrolase [Bacillus pakistanensis]MBM7585478.1 pimeloyl-ACP methyl ester carboxylesterase [Bacillus pakistanensis]